MLSLTPFEIPTYLLALCRRLPAVTTAIAAADDMLVLKGAYSASKEALINPVLVGDQLEIKHLARQIGWNLKGVRVVNANNEQKAVETSAILAKNNEVSAIMKGQVHTDTLMTAILKSKNGLRIGRRISHVFHMTLPKKDKVLMITDGAVNVAPNYETKIDIIKNAIELAHALGNKQPNVAILSGTETPIASMPSSIDAALISNTFKEDNFMGASIYGPLAFDNAISPAAAKLKKLSTPVAGNADILVVPNIETGNSLFKMMVYFMSAIAAGIVIGAKVPIMLTSRGDPLEARIASAALSAIMVNYLSQSNIVKSPQC